MSSSKRDRTRSSPTGQTPPQPLKKQSASKIPLPCGGPTISLPSKRRLFDNEPNKIVSLCQDFSSRQQESESFTEAIDVLQVRGEFEYTIPNFSVIIVGLKLILALVDSK